MEIRTPLVIPALSTRNVGRVDVEDPEALGREVPESFASVALGWLGSQIDESLLVSAYDLHYRKLHDSSPLVGGEANTIFSHPNLLMIDSGLYEVRDRVGYDDGFSCPQEWTPQMYEEVLESLPEDVFAAAVNYDLTASELDEEEMTYAAQIARAQEFTERHRHATVGLLKPETERSFINPVALFPSAADLRVFDIVVVTEKELGNTLGERLRTLARLRQLLDAEGVPQPIHVFGGLDPLLTPLYVKCGAEIVDGVGWLRYAYGPDDVARHIESRAVLELDIDARVPTRYLGTMTDNIGYIRAMKRRLESLIENGNWEVYSTEHGAVLGRLWEQIENGLEGVA